jgi:hypothetical protein
MIKNEYNPQRINSLKKDEQKYIKNEELKQTNTNDIDSLFVLKDLKKLVKNDKQLVINTLTNIRLSYTLDEFEELLYKLNLSLYEFPSFEIEVKKEETDIDNVYQLKMEF